MTISITAYRDDGSIRDVACGDAEAMERFEGSYRAQGFRTVREGPEAVAAGIASYEAKLAAARAAGVPDWRPAPFTGPAWDEVFAELDAEG